MPGPLGAAPGSRSWLCEMGGARGAGPSSGRRFGGGSGACVPAISSRIDAGGARATSACAGHRSVCERRNNLPQLPPPAQHLPSSAALPIRTSRSRSLTMQAGGAEVERDGSVFGANTAYTSPSEAACHMSPCTRDEHIAIEDATAHAPKERAPPSEDSVRTRQGHAFSTVAPPHVKRHSHSGRPVHTQRALLLLPLPLRRCRRSALLAARGEGLTGSNDRGMTTECCSHRWRWHAAAARRCARWRSLRRTRS